MVTGYRRDDPHDEAQEKGYLPDVCETDRVAVSTGIEEPNLKKAGSEMALPFLCTFQPVILNFS